MITEDAAGQADAAVTDESTVQNADPTGDYPDGKPQDDAVQEVKAEAKAKKAPARKRAAKKAAATRKANVETPADLREEHRTVTGGDGATIVHGYDFGNGYGAKVFLREGETEWTWAPTRDGDVIRNIPGLGRVPATTSIENINAGLATVAALKE